MAVATATLAKVSADVLVKRRIVPTISTMQLLLRPGRAAK